MILEKFQPLKKNGKKDGLTQPSGTKHSVSETNDNTPCRFGESWRDRIAEGFTKKNKRQPIREESRRDFTPHQKWGEKPTRGLAV